MDVLYPLMAKKLKDGKQVEDHVLEEHQKIEKDLLEALQLRKASTCTTSRPPWSLAAAAPVPAAPPLLPLLVCVLLMRLRC